MSRHDPGVCPRCGDTDSLEIQYGLPTLELFEAEERGEVALDGCVIVPDAPARRCRRCRLGFGRYEQGE